jgi:hypothetical protein
MSFRDYALIPRGQRGSVVEVVGAQSKAQSEAPTGIHRAIRL